MTPRTINFTSTSPDQTARIAADLGRQLSVGDTVLLEGDVGAGKTHFARALIQSLMDTIEDVPSPTFTLIQTYPIAKGEIWHADLYRLTSTHEIEELGLIEAFEKEICLVEWPDRLGPLLPDHAMTLGLAPGNDESARLVTANWTDPKWHDKLQTWQT